MNAQDRWYSNKTQRFWKCNALILGRLISTKSQIQGLKKWHLVGILETLKSQYGWPIKVELRDKENIAHYFLIPGTDAATLKYPRSAQSLADGAQT